VKLLGMVMRLAASRAESLGLSVTGSILFSATPPEAKPLLNHKGRTESQRLSAREAAKPRINTMTQSRHFDLRVECLSTHP